MVFYLYQIVYNTVVLMKDRCTRREVTWNNQQNMELGKEVHEM